MRPSQPNQGTLLALTYEGVSKTTKKLKNSWFSGEDTHSSTFELKSKPLLLHNVVDIVQWFTNYSFGAPSHTTLSNSLCNTM
jgi:hypothetical protein